MTVDIGLPRPRIGILVLGLALMFGTPSARTAPKAEPVVTALVDGYIRPAYRSFGEAAAASAATVRTLCEMPSEANLGEARTAFSVLAQAWGRAEIVRFGPVTEQNRLERILYWPDRKGIGLKQVQAALANEDATATETATLAGKSVAMQGLGALEFVLFGSGSEALGGSDAAYRCRYGLAIGENLRTISADILAGWEPDAPFVTAWRFPAEGNPLFRDDGEAVGEVFEIFVTGLEMLRDVRLGGFLAADPKDDKPRSALLWRSGQTVQMLRANFDGMRAAFDASGLATGLPADIDWLPGSIDFEFSNGIAAFDAATGPIEDVLADPGKRSKLAYAVMVTSSLTELFGTRLADALGLSAGFSSLDGD